MITRAAILCGGQGTRLASVLGSTPKILAPLGGRAFLFHLLDQLSAFGIKTVVLCTGYGAEEIQSSAGSWYRDMKLVYSREPEALGTAGALRLALPYFGTERFLVFNGDSLISADLKSFTRRQILSGFPCGLLLAPAENRNRFGSVETAENGKILSFQEKSSPSGGWINAGVYVFTSALAAEIPENRKASLENTFFPRWTFEGKLWGFKQNAPLLDFGTPETFAAAQDLFQKEKKR